MIVNEMIIRKPLYEVEFTVDLVDLIEKQCFPPIPEVCLLKSLFFIFLI